MIKHVIPFVALLNKSRYIEASIYNKFKFQDSVNCYNRSIKIAKEFIDDRRSSES